MHEDFTLAADGTAGPVDVSGDIFYQLRGDFGGGTASIQLDFGSGFVEEVSLSAAGQGIIEAPNKSIARLQIVLTGATNPNLEIHLR